MQILSYNFQGPFDFTRGFIKNLPVVYAILDTNTSILDVGETGNINDRFPNHERKSCWIQNGVGLLNLYIYQEPSEANRKQLESAIRQTFNPICGIK